jgi:D-alanyl-D-alanine carboxypeptidase/D-alanyl-D-alanine-endopeptidase (penicillin-binding protein 4)
MTLRLLYVVLLALFMAATPALAKQKQKTSPLDELAKISKASLVFEKGGKTILSKKANTPMVPASTLKLVTALAAIDRWGLDHRFYTDFFLDEKNHLWIKGYGDPYLVSEELDLIVAQLKKKGLKKVAGIYTDTSFFAENIFVDGRTTTDNPYDAPLSALSTNFNTMAFRRDKKGKLHPAEKQTPLTPMARATAEIKLTSKGSVRVNLGTQERAEQYFAELLTEKMKLSGIKVTGKIESGKITDQKLWYRHYNSRTLSNVLNSMLVASSNFIANHLFLMMTDKQSGKPLTMNDARHGMKAWVKKRFKWKKFSIIEGSGLSRGNRLTGKQMLQVVKEFEPYMFLLPKYKGKVIAKTGTLKGVSCYAGFVLRDGKWEPFSLFINQQVGGHFRKQVALTLADQKKLPSF